MLTYVLPQQRLVDFNPAVEKTLTREFKSRNMDRLDTWHAWAIAVDPGHQGFGRTPLLYIIHSMIIQTSYWTGRLLFHALP